MNFYEAILNYGKQKLQVESMNKPLYPEENEENEKRWYKDVVHDINAELGIHCDSDEAFSVFIWDARLGEMHMIFAVDTDKADLEDAKKYIEDYFLQNFDVCDVKLNNIVEITTSRFHQLGEKGDNNGFIRRYRGEESDLKIDYHDNCQYEIGEELISEEQLIYEEAIKCAKEIMADDSLYEELERIYSVENEKKYYGNPVHYKITASNMESAYDIARILTRALKANNRLLGKRISKIYEIKDGCYNESDFKNMFELSHGNIVLMDLSGSDEDHGNYASTYENVISYMDDLIRKNHVKTLCIFVENTEHPGFASKLLGRVAEHIDIIEIKEGCGSRDDAVAYIENLARKNGYEISREEIEEVMPDKKLMTVGETYGIYNNWFRNGLRNRIYRSYRNCTCMEIRKEDKKSEPYDELQKMVGLSNIKGVVDEVIDSARIQKLRSDMGMNSFKTSLHMVFTGNPGSAKTSVARLIAQIFAKEGILSTGKYVECGRADLVGKYVGWTAKTVRAKFKEAKGGILFIDEAYSLVDDTNSFGDEAINTIVQEMENHRDNVIVIFAGYPEKMKEFLNKNEGLRSRIAFHLDFPDYKADEMVDIFKLMADQKGYKYDAEILLRCRNIFERACNKEEFGNGRFVRNCLEQAIMAQAHRIAKEYKGKKVSRKSLATFKVEDFDVNVCEQIEKEKKRQVGFVVSG